MVSFETCLSSKYHIKYIVSSMANLTTKSCGNFQPCRCLSSPTSDILCTLSCQICLRTKPAVELIIVICTWIVSPLVQQWSGDEKCDLSLNPIYSRLVLTNLVTYVCTYMTILENWSKYTPLIADVFLTVVPIQVCPWLYH